MKKWSLAATLPMPTSLSTAGTPSHDRFLFAVAGVEGIVVAFSDR